MENKDIKFLRAKLETKKDIEKEIERCKNPVYFFKNYYRINGEVPTEEQVKELQDFINYQRHGSRYKTKRRRG
jgi:hypothetical protein